ncbi:MAG TPA: glycosyl hydrolase family 79 C-terminal domain-containing protein [Rhodocyclaceae bacterium]|nr:glycosyl hydrolase family 79 C-terminal domain-containing protein [Rhodocyclaceae bacterium]
MKKSSGLAKDIKLDLKRRELLAAALVLPLQACGGGGGGGGSGSSAGAEAPQSSAPVRATVSLNTAQPGATLSSSFTGLSYEKGKLAVPLFTPMNTALINLFKLMGPSILRIGGNSNDKSSWKGTTAGLTVITPAQVDALADFLTATGWQVIYSINLPQNTLAAAADEAAYVANKLGSKLIGFEIGNEPDIYPINGLRPASYSFSDFRTEWQAMAQAVRAAVPGCLLIGPATGTDVTGYTVPFAQTEAASIAMLTQHYYRSNGLLPSSTLELLLAPGTDAELTSRLNAMVGAARSAGLSMGCRMGECNSYSRGGALGISNTYGTALWVIDFLFTLALKNCNGANLHGGGNTAGYTPIADNDGVIEGPRPEFYGIKLFAEAAQGTALPATLTLTPFSNFTAYGVARPDGGRNIMLLNKSGTDAVGVTLNLGIAASNVAMMTLAAPALTSTSGVTLNGASISNSGAFQSVYVQRSITNGQMQIDVAPATAILIKSA